MTQPSTDPAWRRKLALAVVTGSVSGVARAVAAWVLNILHPN